eukprot:gene8057-8887_t
MRRWVLVVVAVLTTWNRYFVSLAKGISNHSLTTDSTGRPRFTYRLAVLNDITHRQSLLLKQISATLSHSHTDEISTSSERGGDGSRNSSDHQNNNNNNNRGVVDPSTITRREIGGVAVAGGGGGERSVRSAKLETNGVSVRRGDLRGSGYYTLNHLLISEKHRFLFCPIQKVASTLFLKLFRRITNQSYWYEDAWNKPTNLTVAWRLGRDRLENIFRDPTWTKAIFFRHPVDRLLSSYHQFLNSPFATTNYSLSIREGVNASISWPHFMHKVVHGGKCNIHWNPQTHFCGYYRYWQYYNFVGDFDHIEEQGKELLQRVGLWDDFGAKGWALAGMRQVFGKHYTLVNETTVVRNLTAVYKDLPASFNKTDCMFCSNYASHRNYPKVNITDMDWETIMTSSFYKSDLDEWNMIKKVAMSKRWMLGPMYEKNSTSFTSYTAWMQRKEERKEKRKVMIV